MTLPVSAAYMNSCSMFTHTHTHTHTHTQRAARCHLQQRLHFHIRCFACKLITLDGCNTRLKVTHSQV